MFPSLNFEDNQSMQQLVILFKDIYKSDPNKDQIERECKRAIIRVATFQGIIRCLDSTQADRHEWHDEYMKVQKHYSFDQLLKNYLETWSTDSFFNPEQGFNLIIYTYSAMQSTIEKEMAHIGANLSLISLNSISKRSAFQ